MVDAITPPPATETPAGEGGGIGDWLKKHWTAALFGLFGVFAAIQGINGGNMFALLVGIIVAACAVGAILKPDARDEVVHLGRKIYDKDIAPIIRIPGPELTLEQLRTPDAEKSKMSATEQQFEIWALQKVSEGKMSGATRELDALLHEMRKGDDQQTLNLQATDVDDKFIAAVPENLKNEAKNKLAELAK